MCESIPENKVKNPLLEWWSFTMMFLQDEVSIHMKVPNKQSTLVPPVVADEQGVSQGVGYRQF